MKQNELDLLLKNVTEPFTCLLRSAESVKP